MKAALVAFLLLIAAGATALLSGIYILAGPGWTLIALGAFVFGLAIVPYRVFYR